MDAQRFIAEFGHIANAPGGVARLRELVLHLAASGDLIETSVPVSAIPLLEAIWRRKEAHPERKKVVSKQSPVPYGLVKAPTHWAICRLGDLTLTITGGGTPSKNNPAYWGGEIPWASVKDLKDQKYIDSTEDHITDEGLRNSSSNLIPINRIIVCTRMGLGKVVINRVELAINQDLKALELPPEVNPDFFFILYKTRDVKGTGTTVSGIKQDQLLALPAALPPTEEQSRIVAKVDELMALCDKLEAQQKSRRQLQTALRQSTLKAVAAATSSDELHAAWVRLSENFPCLFSTPEDVEDLHSLCVELAIRGELISDTVSVDNFTPVSLAEKPFSIPKGWQWIRFDELLRNSESGWSPKCDAEPRKPGEWGVLKVSAVTWGEFRPQENKRLPHSLEPRPEAEVAPGDFLLSRANTAELVARSVVVPDDAPEKLLMSDKIIRLNFIDPERKAWANLVNNSLYARDYYRQNATGTSASMRNVSRRVIHDLMIPLPPKVIQQAILNRLVQLQDWCDTLQRQFGESRKLAERMATATISNLTGITLAPTQDAPMKAPKTELSAPLRSGKKPSVKDPAPLAAILTRQQGGLNAKDLWQRYGGEIDAFYAQLKTEVANGWIQEPEPAVMNEIFESASA